MKWAKPKPGPGCAEAYAQLSACGRYSVAKIGFVGGAFYESWQTRKHAEGPHLIATNLPTAAEARRLCEEHHAAA